MSIPWETILVALIQAIAAISTAWIERGDRRERHPHKKGAKHPSSHHE